MFFVKSKLPQINWINEVVTVKFSFLHMLFKEKRQISGTKTV